MSQNYLSICPPTTFVPNLLGHPSAGQAALFEDLAPATQKAILKLVFTDEIEVEWSEEDVVYLHFFLLKKIEKLGDPDTPLNERLDIVMWMFTDSKHDNDSFSFAACVNTVALSPLSPLPYYGMVDVEEIRNSLRSRARSWVLTTIAEYPLWIREQIIENTGWVESKLEMDPQWINKEIRKSRIQGDLFA